MKTKDPTQDQIVDFYYYLVSSLCEVGYIYQENEKEKMFLCNPEKFSKFVDDDLDIFPRETSPEVYEYYVSDGDLNLIRSRCGLCIKSVYLCHFGKHKIKITICEDE